MLMLMREWRTHVIAIAAMTVFAATGAIAIGATPAETIKSRQENLKALGRSMKTINDQLKLSAPDKSAIKAAGAKIKSTSEVIGTWFPKGTGPEAGVETAAKPGIWTDAGDFAAKVKAFQVEASKLVLLTEAGNIDGVREQARPTGKSCGGCHDTYRVKKET